MTAQPDPEACLYCDIALERHARRWSPEIGWHSWIAPTDQQRRVRMLAAQEVRR